MSARAIRSTALRAGLALTVSALAFGGLTGTASADTGGNGFPGSVKIAFPNESTDVDNTAKPGCTVRLDFFGFRPGRLNAVFKAVSPTGDKQTASGSVTITKPRTPASVLQARKLFTLNVAGLTPDNLGYHMRVDVTDPDRTGNGSKSKVFAYKCAPGGATPTAYSGQGTFGASVTSRTTGRAVSHRRVGSAPAAATGFATGAGGTSGALPLGSLLGLTAGLGLLGAGVVTVRRSQRS